MMRSTTNYVNQDDFLRILNYIPFLKIRKWKDEDIKFLFKISYWCGLRFIEACLLKNEDIDIERREIHLGQTKTEKNAKVVIPDPFLNELIDWLVVKEQGRLFPGLGYDTAYKWLKKIGRELHIEALNTPQAVSGEKTVTHIFRKSIGKDMMFSTHTKQAAPLNVISKQLRHKDIKSTQEYLKVGDEVVKEFWE